MSTFFYMTMHLIGELVLCTLIWGVIIFLLITGSMFFCFWMDFFREILQAKKERKLMYLPVDTYFLLQGVELTDDEIALLTERAEELSSEKKIHIKDEDLFHKNILSIVFREWTANDKAV